MVNTRIEKESVSRSLTRFMAVVAAAMLAVFVCFAMAGCSSGSSSSSSASSAANVAPAQPSSSSASAAAGDMTVDVDLMQSVTSPEAPDSVNQFAEENMSVSVSDGATALDALKATGREIDTQGEGDNLEVSSIGGLVKGDAGASSHWEFSVNGQVITASPAVYTLSNGDKVTFNFVK